MASAPDALAIEAPATKAPHAAPTSEGPRAATGEESGFRVHLAHFDGPFDLLLQLITRRRLDVTELALAEVTDEFVAHLAAQGEWDLDEASEFLVIAATLLDLKAARLLPSGEVEDEADLELLEARDLLFARLLQYRAFKNVAFVLGELWESGARRFARSVPLEPQFAALLPPLDLNITPQRLAKVAARAISPPRPPQVSVAHLHHAAVAVADEANVVVDRLRAVGTATFAELIADAPSPAHVVARFLALLELYRTAQVSFAQPEALEELSVTWQGADAGDVRVADDYDDAGWGDR